VIITKPVLGTLEIDLERGVLWLNTEICVLRICKLKFMNKLEKFSSIDITDGNVFMETHEMDNDLLKEKLYHSLVNIYSKTLSHKDPDELLSKIEKLLEEN